MSKSLGKILHHFPADGDAGLSIHIYIYIYNYIHMHINLVIYNSFYIYRVLRADFVHSWIAVFSFHILVAGTPQQVIPSQLSSN